MKNVLILGGTRFVGKKLLDQIADVPSIRPYVASRREIDTDNFIKIDRKNKADLKKAFSEEKFDVVVDFINFSAPDSQLLLEVIEELEQEPHLISISSVYAYSEPGKLEKDKVYSEEDFEAEKEDYSMQDLPQLNYTQGKRAMEAFLMQNYPAERQTIVRFPVILGADDYTGRAFFFRDIIKENKQINLTDEGKKANYIFSDEAAEALLFFIKTETSGTYNISVDPAVDEKEAFEDYCEFYERKSSEFLKNNEEEVHSPFFYSREFVIDSEKFKGLHHFEIDFKEGLFRELRRAES